MLSDELNGVKLEKPILQWVQENTRDKGTLEVLMKVYRRTNDLYDERFTPGNSTINKLTNLLFELEEYKSDNNQNAFTEKVDSSSKETINKAKRIVKANILLRRGQVKSNEFIESSYDFQAACAILEYTFQKSNLEENSSLDFLDFLAWINLGKYFRNMGMCYGRSDYYWRAHDEFVNVLKALKNRKNTENSEVPSHKPWELYIWLETIMNLSRTKLYLYKTKEAKAYLWRTYFILCDLLGIMLNEKSLNKVYEISKQFVGVEGTPDSEISQKSYEILARHNFSKLFVDEKVDNMRTKVNKIVEQSENNSAWMPEIFKYFNELIAEDNDKGCIWESSTKEYLDVLHSYLIQVLLQLGICYRKTRDYNFSRRILLDLLNNVDVKNVDAKNNYAVCIRKEGFKISYIDKEKEKTLLNIRGNEDPSVRKVREGYFFMINSLIKGGGNEIWNNNSNASRNRFATIEYIRALLQEGNNNKEKIDEAEKMINELLDKNPADRNITLQKALLLQKIGKTQESQKILEKLYLEAPQISAGTIGLKVYYNIGCNLLQEKKFYEAMKHFSKIKGEISKDKPSSDNAEPDHDLELEDLPKIDLLSSVDYAWCLMNIGDYTGAKEEYEYIILHYKNQSYRMGHYNKMKVENNLTECLLQKLSCEIQNTQNKKTLIQLDKAIDDKLNDLEKLELNNFIVSRNRGYYYLLKARMKLGFDKIFLYNKAIEQFNEAMISRYNDVYICSGWVCAAYELLERCLKEGEASEKEYKNMVEKICNKIKSGVGVYSVRSCAKLSEMLLSIQSQDVKLEDEMLYRSIARINISKDEDGYEFFQNLRENDIFNRLEAQQRGKIMVYLFQLYDIILKIKRDCQFYHTRSNELPVHYRSMARLKSYLLNDSKNKGRLSLWNIAYMNDYQEGQSFIVMLKSQSKMELASMVDRCFFRQVSEKIFMSAGNENVYITSLSLKKDFIPMWIAYADNGTGCALEYSEDFLNLRKGPDYLTDVSEYSDRDFPLYKVVYVNTKKYITEDSVGNADGNNQEKADGKNQEREKDLIESLGKTSNIIDQLVKYIDGFYDKDKSDTEESNMKEKNTKNSNLRDFIEQIIGTCLNQIRFLVKDIEYESEEEVRIVHYSKEHLVDAPENKMPRLYIELDRDVQIEQVTLGPKVNSYDESELITWLNQTGRVKHIQRSERHYR